MILSLVNLIIYIVIVAIVAAIIIWIIDLVPPLREQPINRYLKLAISVIAALVVILALLQFIGLAPTTGLGTGPRLVPQ
jgi:hypothetical protein